MYNEDSIMEGTYLDWKLKNFNFDEWLWNAMIIYNADGKKEY